MFLITLPAGTEFLIILAYIAILALCIFDVYKSTFSVWQKVVLIIGLLLLPPVTLIYFVILVIKLLVSKRKRNSAI